MDKRRGLPSRRVSFHQCPGGTLLPVQFTQLLSLPSSANCFAVFFFLIFFGVAPGSGEGVGLAEGAGVGA
jgi:hypothetical protein